MYYKRISFLLLFFIGNILYSNAQPYMEKEKIDSALTLQHEKNDSTFYDNINRFAQRSRFNKFVHGLIFRKPKKETDTTQIRNSTVVYDATKFQGKVIRNVIIIRESPFDIPLHGDSINFFSQENLKSFGNFLHVNTRTFVIRGLLLFRQHDKFDVLTIQESERLIRSQAYIDRSSIFGIATPNSDSVDVVVNVKDAFSLLPEGHLSTSRIGLGIRNINFLGLGHSVHANWTWRFSEGLNNYQYDYTVPTINSTFINTGIIYRRNFADSSYIKQFSINRPFYSSLAKWAGGISIAQQRENGNILLPETAEIVDLSLKYNSQDYWGAYSLRIKNRNYEKSLTQNVIFSARFYQINYLDRPREYDPTNIYTRENLYLAGIGFSERRYKRDKFIFRYGFVEDVPIGQLYNLIGGFQNKNGKNRLYLATQLSRGRYFRSGYYSGTIEYGSFFNKFRVEEGVVTTSVTYFTPLIEFGGWKLRQFVKPQFMFGINRLETDKVYLNNYFGIDGFSNEIFGTQKFVCNFQTQLFPPWDIWGFKIGPYFLYSLGMLGNKKDGFSKSSVYSLFGLGFLVRNDRLVFNSFEFSVSFYPYIPGDGHHIFKFNSYNARNFGISDFDVRKPDMVVYQ